MDSYLVNLTFKQLVDEMAGDVLKGLIAGKFNDSIFVALDTAIRWHLERKAAGL